MLNKMLSEAKSRLAGLSGRKFTAILLVLGLAVPVFCQTGIAVPAASVTPVQPAPAQMQPVKKAAFMKANGSVVSTDAAKNQIVVSVYSKKEKKNNELTFSVDAKTAIKKEGKTIALADISQGQKVSVRYETAADGTKVAMSIIALVASKPVPAKKSVPVSPTPAPSKK